MSRVTVSILNYTYIVIYKNNNCSWCPPSITVMQSQAPPTTNEAVYAVFPSPTTSSKESDLLLALQQDGLMNEYGISETPLAEPPFNLEEELAKLNILQLKVSVEPLINYFNLFNMCLNILIFALFKLISVEF